MEGDIDPETIRFRLQESTATRLIVIDELDRLEDNDALSLLADTVKTLSDHHVSATLMFVGVAQSLDQLVGEHESIVRSLVQVPMPRMSAAEMEGIFAKGLPSVPLEIDADAKAAIILMAEGLPHFVHLLALHAGRAAIENERRSITLGDVYLAMRDAAQTHTMMSSYTKATHSNQTNSRYQEVLFACAFAPKVDGWFRASDVRGPLAKILGKPVTLQTFARHIEELSSDERGNSLTKFGRERRYRYRFKDPLLEPFCKMVALERGLVTRSCFEDLESTFPGSMSPKDQGWPTEQQPPS